MAAGAVQNRDRQFRPDRHHHFGGACRRRRAHVRHIVEQGPIGLVADGRYSGISLSAAARTTVSSLKPQRSSIEPPPRATISTSGRGIFPPGFRALKPRIAAATSSAQVSPCTRTGQTST